MNSNWQSENNQNKLSIQRRRNHLMNEYYYEKAEEECQKDDKKRLDTKKFYKKLGWKPILNNSRHKNGDDKQLTKQKSIIQQLNKGVSLTNNNIELQNGQLNNQIDMNKIEIQCITLSNFDQSLGQLFIDIGVYSSNGLVKDGTGQVLQYQMQELPQQEDKKSYIYLGCSYKMNINMEYLIQKYPQEYQNIGIIFLISLEPNEKNDISQSIQNTQSLKYNGGEEILIGWFSIPLVTYKGELNRGNFISHIYNQDKNIKPQLPNNFLQKNKDFSSKILNFTIQYSGENLKNLPIVNFARHQQLEYDKKQKNQEIHKNKQLQKQPQISIQNQINLSLTSKNIGYIALNCISLDNFDESKGGLAFDYAVLSANGIVKDRKNKKIQYSSEDIFDGDSSDSIVEIYHYGKIFLSHADIKAISPSDYKDYRILFNFSINLFEKEGVEKEEGEQGNASSSEQNYGWYVHHLFDQNTGKPNIGNFRVNIYRPPMISIYPLENNLLHEMQSQFQFQLFFVTS